MSQPEKSERDGKRTKTIFHQEYRRLIQELIRVRKKLKLSQTTVANQVGWPDHTYLSKVETLEKRLDVVELAQLSKIYGKSPGFFMKFLKF